VHDITDFEERGLPGVFVATTEFTEAAERQGRALGSRVASIFVAHPIQDREPGEVRALAERALEEILRCIALPTD
jgi:hypothetical protein